MSSKVSIIILNWNGLGDTIRCLESLKKITYPNYEVIVVDNGSKGNEADVLEKKYKGYIRLIRNKENLGFAEGNNVAIREVIKEGKSDYILTLNNDTTVEPNFLDELVECAKRHPKAGSIQPKMLFSWNSKFIFSVGLIYFKNGLACNRGIGEKADEYRYNKEEKIFGCSAGACLYKVEALKDVKIDDEIFDKDFFLYCEDVDLALRLRWAGWESWYCPKAIVHHFGAKTTSRQGWAFRIYYNTRNQTYLIIKHFPIFFIFKNLFWIGGVKIGRIAFSLLKGKMWKVKSSLRGEIDAFRNINKILEKRRKIKKKVDFSKIEKFFSPPWKRPKHLEKLK